MHELFTPWRMRYIVSNREGASCVFCLESNADPGQYFILHRGSSCFVILNVYPYTLGHLMVVPHRHVGRLSDLKPAEMEEMSMLLRASERNLRVGGFGQQFCTGVNLERPAGAGVVGHLHAHLVPLPDFPCAQRDELVESINQTYARLLPAYARLASGR